ncbi:MAG: hypothetical protein KDB14_03135 [Planctomycetales bacterium]|nr:hypothetical protein [Planctomycetales bacterium]
MVTTHQQTPHAGAGRRRPSPTWLAVAIVLLAAATDARPSAAADPVQKPREDDYYRLISIATSPASTGSRSKFWKPAPNGLTLEVSGMDLLDDRLAVAIRKGEVWLLSGVYEDPPEHVRYHRFANALHEPLGLLRDGDSFLTVQRTELTRLIDRDGDDVCDEYLTEAKGWGVTGNYHEYAYGPKRDGEGNLWLTLNIGLGLKSEHQRFLTTHPQLKVSQAPWRGWGLRVGADGELEPMCAGMRSPSGLGANLAGDMFYTDQQGNWVGTNTLHHMRKGAFFHHIEALASAELPSSPLKGITSVPSGVPFPEALKQMPQLKAPAVWLPYKKVGQSATDIMVDASNGKFGPFAGQLFVGEFTLSSVNRVFLEQVDGEYQGACFPFREGFASAVLRLTQGKDGSVFAGLTNRGWSSLGAASYGLQRLVWTGRTPLEIREMRARPAGFELTFTKPVDAKSAGDITSYRMRSHTYLFQPQYGSDEILARDLEIQSAEVSADRLKVTLTVAGLRPYFVHELRADGVRGDAGEPLLHADAYYTLNRIPAK